MAQQLLRRPVRSVGAPSLQPRSIPLPHVLRGSNVIRASELPSPCLLQAPQPTVQRRLGSRLVCQATAESADERMPEYKRAKLERDESPVYVGEPGERPMPMPSEYQQTLWCSIYMAGIGLHTGEYACVRVRPAYAGEGRYFVRVPYGTNLAQAHERLDQLREDPVEDNVDNPEVQALFDDNEYKQKLITQYQAYVDAQAAGFSASFMDFLEGQQLHKLVERLKTEGPPGYQLFHPEDIVLRSEDEPYVLANSSSLADINPINTALIGKGEGGFEVVTVEALLSALEACGVDNARIEIEGGLEVPVIDGSASGWAQEIAVAGLRWAPSRADLAVPWADRAQPGQKYRQPGVEVEEKGEAAEGAAEGEEGEPVDREPLGGQPIVEPEGVTPKMVLRPTKVIAACRGASFITLYPEDTFRFTAGVDRRVEAPVIGKQWFTWCMFEDTHYNYTIAEARSFATCVEQLIGMRGAGWLQGGTDGVMIIGNGANWYDQTVVTYEDEPARRQVLDLIGDLSLLSRHGHSGLPLGHIVSYNADHELNNAFVLKLLAETTDEDWVPLKDVLGHSVPIDYTALMGTLMNDNTGDEDDEGAAAELYGEGEAAAAVEDDDEEEELYDEYDEEEEDGQDEGGEEFVDEDEEAVVDVEASPVEPPEGPRGGKGRI